MIFYIVISDISKVNFLYLYYKNIIANSIYYTHLLERYIDKEDRVIYKFAQRVLSKEILEEIDKDCIKFENKSKDIKGKYILLFNKFRK